MNLLIVLFRRTICYSTPHLLLMLLTTTFYADTKLRLHFSTPILHPTSPSQPPCNCTYRETPHTAYRLVRECPYHPTRLPSPSSEQRERELTTWRPEGEAHLIARDQQFAACWTEKMPPSLLLYCSFSSSQAHASFTHSSFTVGAIRLLETAKPDAAFSFFAQ